MKLSDAQLSLLGLAAKYSYRPLGFDIAGYGAGAFSTARSLERRGLVVSVHPGGMSWGEMRITEAGRAELHDREASDG